MGQWAEAGAQVVRTWINVGERETKQDEVERIEQASGEMVHWGYDIKLRLKVCEKLRGWLGRNEQPHCIVGQCFELLLYIRQQPATACC